MTEKDNWKQVEVTYRLFGYESDGGRLSDFWNNPIISFTFPRPMGRGRILDDDFSYWLQSHRSFTRDEVLKGRWIKISDLRTSREARLQGDGTLTENELFKPQSSWQGTWKIISGVLIMQIGGYDLSIYATNEGSMHSGIEIFEDKPYAYFKVIHLI